MLILFLLLNQMGCFTSSSFLVRNWNIQFPQNTQKFKLIAGDNIYFVFVLIQSKSLIGSFGQKNT